MSRSRDWEEKLNMIPPEELGQMYLKGPIITVGIKGNLVMPGTPTVDNRIRLEDEFILFDDPFKYMTKYGSK